MDPLQYYVKDKTDDVLSRWPQEIRNAVHGNGGLLAALESEVAKYDCNVKNQLQDTGRFGAGEWINTVCQIVGAAGVISQDTIGESVEMARAVLLMYGCFVYIREPCLDQWGAILPEDSLANAIVGTLWDDNKYHNVDSPQYHFRRVRNSISHARWKVSDDGRCVIFQDAPRNNPDHIDFEVSVPLYTVLAEAFIVGYLVVALSGYVLGVNEGHSMLQ